MSTKFDEFPSLPFQDIKEKPKRHGQTDTRTWKQYTPTNIVCGGGSIKIVKIRTLETSLHHWVLRAEDVDGTANSVDPDQTAPLAAIWSGTSVFTQACLSDNRIITAFCFFFNVCSLICNIYSWHTPSAVPWNKFPVCTYRNHQTHLT